MNEGWKIGNEPSQYFLTRKRIVQGSLKWTERKTKRRNN